MGQSRWTSNDYMRLAIRLAGECPRVDNAYAVGCVIVDRYGRMISTGFSREDGGRGHAEQIAIAKVDDPESLKGATLYSTMEPCSARDSFPVSCSQLIIQAGIARVFYAVREPVHFKTCKGAHNLCAGGIEVREMPRHRDAAWQPNAHILKI